MGIKLIAVAGLAREPARVPAREPARVPARPSAPAWESVPARPNGFAFFSALAVVELESDELER
jgi:hypothetical protein